MSLEVFILGGYGQFVWPAFIFTCLSCTILYLKTNKELQKQEKLFLSKYEKQSIATTKATKEKKIAKEVLSANTI